MCGFTGPISTLPGHAFKVPDEVACDSHPNIIATHRIQGETDSFGSELLDMCSDCYAEHLESAIAISKELAACDWCDVVAAGLVKTRDYEEGMSGPVYDVCPACISVRTARASKETKEYFEDY
ncbi:MAG: hypothetical protein ACD_84C00005G0004 [uncultured bacterium]|nr:MAG: hypothetical protein ACD_84C00005G0004 [uncultured bacterium]